MAQNIGVISDNSIFEASHYLTKCVFTSLGEMFSSASAIQVRCAQRTRICPCNSTLLSSFPCEQHESLA